MLKKSKPSADDEDALLSDCECEHGSKAQRHGLVDHALRYEPAVLQLPTETSQHQQSEMSHLHETLFKHQQDVNFKSAQRHTARAESEMAQKVPPNSYYVETDRGTRYSAPTYVLQNRIVEDPANLESRRSCAMKRSTNYNTSATASTQRQKLQTRGRTNQLCAPYCNKPSSVAVRNKSMECNVTTGSAVQSTVRPSLTTSATVTKCSTQRPPSTRTKHQLQRKIHSGKTFETVPPLKRPLTYSVKKPLPYKAGSATARRQSSTTKNLSECLYVSPSSESLFTQISDAQWQHDDIDDDNDARHSLRSDKLTSGIVNKSRSRPKMANLPTSPTPKPSIKQLKDVRIGHSLQQPPRTNDDVMLSQQPYVSSQLSKSRSCNKGRKDEMKVDGQASGTVRSHSSPSEHSFTSRYDNHYYIREQQQQQQQQGCTEPVDCATRHVQITSKLASQQQQQQQSVEQYQQTSDLMSSASQESVVSCRPHQHNKTRMLRQPPPTSSMCTVATDAGRFVTRPVPVAPSGPAGHRRASKIPRPKQGTRPSASVTSTISKCSSITSLRSEFNYARPMPIERIPLSKFGLECIVPLARQEVSVKSVEAFSITGVSGQRKRFLPLIESIPKDLWERPENAVAPLPIVKAWYDAGDDCCSVSIISSKVARSVSHAATQTHKSVSVATASGQRKKRKAKTEKHDDNNEDYSGMLMRLVQLVYLQTKLNASKSDKNNSASDEVTNQSPGSHRTHNTLLDHLQKQQQRHRPPHTNTSQHSSNHGAKVYRMGSSVTQVYSKNYPGAHVDSESANSWANAIKSRTVYFDNVQSEAKPWSIYQGGTSAAFKPNQRHSYDNRHARVSSYSGMRYGYRPTLDY